MIRPNFKLLLFLLLGLACSNNMLSQTKYGALAIDRSNGFYYGFSYDQNSIAEAEERAIAECNNRGGEGTVVLEWSGSGCAAYRTIDGNVGTAYGWGLASTKEAADAIATAECRKRSNGSAPSNYVWACNAATTQPLRELKNLKEDIPESVPVATQNYYLQFNGTNFLANGDCPGDATALFSTEDEAYVVIFNNIPSSGSVSVDDSFYTNSCTSCIAIQITDINTSTTYVATSGSFSRNGNDISFNLTAKDMLGLFEDNGGSSVTVSGTFSCSE